MVQKNEEKINLNDTTWHIVPIYSVLWSYLRSLTWSHVSNKLMRKVSNAEILSCALGIHGQGDVHSEGQWTNSMWQELYSVPSININLMRQIIRKNCFLIARPRLFCILYTNTGETTGNVYKRLVDKIFQSRFSFYEMRSI